MSASKYMKCFGLTRRRAETLRALFEAGAASSEVPGWVLAPSNRRALRGLARAGLVSEKARLTLSGLAVAASLPALERLRWLAAA